MGHALMVLLALALVTIPIAWDYRGRRFLVWFWTFLLAAVVSMFIPIFH